MASQAGSGAEKETGLINKSAVAFEKHRIRLWMAARTWRAITTNLLTRACATARGKGTIVAWLSQESTQAARNEGVVVSYATRLLYCSSFVWAHLQT
jgi:hypothetical protein